MEQKTYPVIKLILWRYFRAFISTFLVTLGTQLEVLNITDLNKAVLVSLAVASASAGLQAMGKLIRENWADDMSSLVHKLPF
jgi:hypothetical protein